jgi:hypothetical protein
MVRGLCCAARRADLEVRGARGCVDAPHRAMPRARAAASPRQHRTAAARRPCSPVSCAAAGVIDCAKKTVQWEGLPGLYKVRGGRAPPAGPARPHVTPPPGCCRLATHVHACVRAALPSKPCKPCTQAHMHARALRARRHEPTQGVASPLAGQMFFRASLFGAFGSSKRWLATNADGSARPLVTSDYYKAGAITGFIAAFTEGPIDFYKSQIQVQIIRSKSDPTYKPPYTTVSACVRATLRDNGFKGPFQVRGWLVCVCGGGGGGRLGHVARCPGGRAWRAHVRCRRTARADTAHTPHAPPHARAHTRQGLGATILRNTPANAVYLGTFEVLKGQAAKQLGKVRGVSHVHGGGGVRLGTPATARRARARAHARREPALLEASCNTNTHTPRAHTTAARARRSCPRGRCSRLPRWAASHTGWPSSPWTSSSRACRRTPSSPASGATQTL